MVPREVVAVDRHYFQNTGVYETVMSPWDGENLELSFKVCPRPREVTGEVMGEVVGVRKSLPWSTCLSPSLSHPL